MISTTTPPPSRKTPLLLGLLLLLALSWYYFHAPPVGPSQPYIYAASERDAPPFPHEIITDDLIVDWSGGGDFDPRGKCPDDFFGGGFVLLCKRMADGTSVKFLWHQGKRLLYRVDRDLIKGKARIGLHWVTGTRFNARYRIADPAYQGGKVVEVPTAKGEKAGQAFRYGQAVSKRRTQYHRELFRETHIQPGQCPEWWDIFNFRP